MDLSCAAEYPDAATALRLTGGVWHHLPRTRVDVMLDPSTVGAPVTVVWRIDPSTGVGFWDLSRVHRFATYRPHRDRYAPSGGPADRSYVGRARVREGAAVDATGGRSLPAAVSSASQRPADVLGRGGRSRAW